MWSFRIGAYPVAELQYLRYLCMVDDSHARKELGFRPTRDLQKTLESVLSER
jgi:UDP-glucose 4-epimerase